MSQKQEENEDDAKSNKLINRLAGYLFKFHLPKGSGTKCLQDD